MSATVGSNAPDFTLSNQDRQPVTLSAPAGKNRRARIFPGGVHVGVPEGAVPLPRSARALQLANAMVYGISVDTPFTLKEFAKQNALNFDLLSDFNKDAIPSSTWSTRTCSG